MRLLILGNWHALSNAHQYSLAFRRLGHEVVTCGPRFTEADAARWHANLLAMEWPPTPEEAGAYVAEVLAGSPVPDYTTAPGEQLTERVVQALGPFDAVLTFDAHGDNPTLNVGVSNIPSAIIVGDSHTINPASVHALLYGHLFLQFRRADLAQFDHPSKHWLPPAADPRIWVHVPDMPKEYDVLFVGATDPTIHTERVELLRFLKRELGEGRVVVKHLFGERAALEMNRARVVLNRSLAGDLNMRVLETRATGALLLTDEVDGVGVLGIEERYGTPEDALQRIGGLLHSPLSKKWARQRRKGVMERHTYEHRAQQILDVLFGGKVDGGGGGVSAGHAHRGRDRADGKLVSIVIPVFNHHHDLTRPLLEMLAKDEEVRACADVLVVDDGSTDSTACFADFSYHHTPGQDPFLVPYLHQDNAGFAAACNTGAREAKGEYLIFLNNDCEPQENWLPPLLAALDDGAGIAGPWLQTPDGDTQSAGLIQDGQGNWHNRDVCFGPAGAAAYEESAITGACLAIKRDTFWRLGGFDEGYEGGGGCDDVDLCLRARQQGLRVVLVPESVVIHKEGSTRGTLPETASQIARNQARLRERWGSGESNAVDSKAGGVFPAGGGAGVGPDGGAALARKPTYLTWDGSVDTAQSGSLAVINNELIKRLMTFGIPELSDANLGRVRISHRWTGADKAWSLPTGDIDHWLTIVPWEGMAPVPSAWLEAFKHPKHRAVLTPSEHSARFFVEAGVPPEKVKVVPNGVDLSVFTPDGPKLPIHTGADDVFRVLFVGGLIRRKGIDLLYEAWRRAFTPDERVRLVLKAAGTQTFYSTHSEYPPDDLPNVQVLDRDDFMPEVMARLYRSCDVLVLPSRGEAFGLPVLEAMACGKPVSVPDGGPFDEYVPVAARVATVPLVPKELAQALRWSYIVRSRLAEVGQAGRRAAEQYGWDAIAPRYAAVIKEVCQ